MPLEAVLLLHGAVPDVRDTSKWHTAQGPLSVSGAKFMNWSPGTGGGGAIDLVMHLARADFRTAVAWLERNFDAATRQQAGVMPLASAGSESPCVSVAREAWWTEAASRQLCLPVADSRRLDQVRRYLTGPRHLPELLLEPLIESGRLYGDQWGNAVFLLLAGADSTPVGAELRGTSPGVWRGMARGTRKDRGYFWTGTPESRTLILCESAIDALSCEALEPGRLCISTSGTRLNPHWLRGLVDRVTGRGGVVHCGFDTDEAGEAAARAMIALYPAIERLCPPAHDWNDALVGSTHA